MAKSFQELSPRAQIIVFVMLCGAATFGAWQFLLSPAHVSLAERQAHMATVEGDLARARLTAAKLPQFQQEVRQLEAALLETTAVIPEEKDPQDVLRNLHELASESALSIASFAPKAVVTKPQYSEWPIELGMEGGYHDLGRFFDRVAGMSRLISVSDLKITSRVKADGRGTISATCVATTYVFKKEAALAASGGRP
jgi:type IV pilus assembly protein PilO